MSDFVLDLDDKEVRVGDRIAYSVTTGRSANVRIGTVVEIVWGHTRDDDKYDGIPYHIDFRYWGTNHKVPTKLRVKVEKSSFAELWSDKPTLIEAGFKRFVKLG